MIKGKDKESWCFWVFQFLSPEERMFIFAGRPCVPKAILETGTKISPIKELARVLILDVIIS
jgi:hypothetical protein